ncbi:MAG: 8-oxo-dGTP diphosphatase [Candidatus ainarchaeum sp.]|nr:8-oxo-dGTP diphosphatase [Candidatus ainarchaeum sp.]MDD4128846.1 8-oxo-dGTP diphosphatase [Candidatus ainarchaeum sp.]
MKKILTLALAINGNKILLGMKKRGFGVNRWNGFGGKVEHGETITQGAKREIFEECEIKANKLQKRGILTFIFEGEEKELEVHIYIIKKFSGTPTETEEMKPKWFANNKIPFKDMWPDDEIWLPYFLAGKKFVGTIYFKDQNTIKTHDIHEVKKLWI